METISFGCETNGNNSFGCKNQWKTMVLEVKTNGKPWFWRQKPMKTIVLEVKPNENNCLEIKTNGNHGFGGKNQ